MIPRVVLVTPSLNQGRFIRQTIESVISQNYPELEYYVIDGGSDDETLGILQEYTGQITDWKSEKDTGQSSAINKGWQMSAGADLYGWINSDDYLLPEALHSIARVYQEGGGTENDCGMIVGSGFKVDERGCKVKEVSVKAITQHCPKTAFQFLQSSAFFSGRALREHGLLKEELNYSMDWDITLRISRSSPIVYFDRYLSCQRVYPTTKTNTGGWQRNREIASIGRNHNGRFDRNYLIYKLYSTLLRVVDEPQIVRAGLRYKLARIAQGVIGRTFHPLSYMIHW